MLILSFEFPSSLLNFFELVGYLLSYTPIMPVNLVYNKTDISLQLEE